MNNKIVIVGFGGHAKSLADSIMSDGKYEIAGYTDSEETDVLNIPYLGTDDELKSIFDGGVQNAAVGVGYIRKSDIRDKLYDRLISIGFELPVIIDPSAIIALEAQIGEGSFIGKRAVINAGVKVGKMCIINTGSIIEHENIIGDFTHIAVGATLCGNVGVGDHCMIGANSTVIQGVHIGSYSTVGAGAVVINNIESNKTVVGVPARVIK